MAAKRSSNGATRVKASVWTAKARRVFGTKEQRGLGDGRFAVYTECQLPAFSLHPSRESAEAAKRVVDVGGCGGKCPLKTRSSKHRIVDLAEADKP